MMQEVEVLKTIQELICSFFSEEQFTLSGKLSKIDLCVRIFYNQTNQRNRHFTVIMHI